MRWFGRREKGDDRPSPQPSARDRVVRVFVSSTFRDMVEDRDELMTRAWPALRRLCRSRAVEFVEVDLRWGVTEEQAQRKEVLRHCLAEIRRCRPYFIGILGERYGWKPGPEAYSEALLNEEDWLKAEVAQHSVTELEILHGVLRDPEQARRSYFYFRDPGYAAARGADYRPEDEADAERQAALKARVREVCREKGIPLHEGYADPLALAEQVLADLTAAIEAEFPADRVPDAWTREERDHEAFARSRRTRFYVGRDAYYDRLEEYARDGADGCGLVVLGESGSGKSALLANWVARRRQAHPDDFIFQHYIGSSPASASHLGLMRRLMVAVIRWCGDSGARTGLGAEEERIPAGAEEIEKAFPEYLDRLAAETKRRGVGAVIVFDALNQLEDRERGRLLGWLPHRLPGALRLVTATLPGDTLDALGPRDWPELTVEPLSPDERVRLIAGYLAHFSQALSEARAGRIAASPAAANPLFLKTLLDDLRATGAHDRLDEQIDGYLCAPDIPDLLGMILARYERAYEQDRPGLVKDALSLLWAARRGLTEPELLELLRAEGQDRLPAAHWSPVRCALEDGLVDRDGVLAFAHEHLRKAAAGRYVRDDGAARSLRVQLADYFAARPIDARQADELPWLLWQAEARDHLRACLLDIDRFLLMKRRDEEELRGYWVWLKEEQQMGKPYLQGFEDWAKQPKRDELRVGYVADQLGEFLDNAALHAEAEPLLERALVIAEKSYGPEHPDVAATLSNLAYLYRATNRLAEAEPLMRRALAIDEKSYGKDHPEVATVLNNLALLLKAFNRLGEAEPLMRRVLAIDETSYGKDHPNVARDLSNLAGLLKDTNRLGEAEPLMRRALAIYEKSYGESHPNVAMALNNLVGLLKDTNRLGEAEPLMRRVVSIFEKSYGEGHPNVATALNNLAGLLQGTNRLGEAEPLMRRALAIDEASYGKDHPKVAIRLSNLAALLDATNRHSEAEPLMRRALAIDEKSYGKDHPEVAVVLNNLAGLLQDTNRLGEAEPLMRRVVEILLRFTQATGHQHPRLQVAVSNYAVLLSAMGRSGDEIKKTMTELGQRYGVDLSSVTAPAAGPSPKLRAIVEQMMRDPSKTLEIEDPALLQELLGSIQSQQGKK